MFGIKAFCVFFCTGSVICLTAAAPEGWETDFHLAQKKAVEAKKPIFIYFDAPGNKGSARLRKEILEQKAFREIAEKKLILYYSCLEKGNENRQSGSQKNDLRKQLNFIDPYGGVLVGEDGSFIGNVGMWNRSWAYLQRLQRFLEPIPEIVKFARKDDWKKVRAQVEAGVDVNAQDGFGFSALHVAARDGNREMVELLLKYGGKINQCDADGNTPLHQACMSGKSLETVQLLLNEFASLLIRNKNGESPFFTAVYGGNPEILKLLISEGADPNLSKKGGETPLIVAVQSQKEKVVAVLLERKVDLSRTDRFKRTAQFYSEHGKSKNATIASMLAKAAADGKIR